MSFEINNTLIHQLYNDVIAIIGQRNCAIMYMNNAKHIGYPTKKISF